MLSFIYKPLHAARRAMGAACRCLEATAALFNTTISCPRSILLGRPYPLLSIAAKQRKLHCRQAWPTFLSPVAQVRPVHLLWGRPTCTDTPYPVLPKEASTASVDFSFHSHLPEGALGCFHPWAFPMSLHSFLIWGIQALHSVKR